MWGLLAILLFFPLGCFVDAACNRTVFSHFNETPCLNLSIPYPHSKVNFTMWQQVKELDLSNNNITELSELKSSKKLESLFLHNNKLKKLPSDFFNKTPTLKVLHLEKNQLGSLSIKVSYHCLKELHVDCQCKVAVGILRYCHNCSDQGTRCQCFTSGRLDNVTDYHKNNCPHSTGYGLYVGIIVPILILLLLAILVFFVIRRKKGATINQEKRPSSTSEGTSGQSRYITRLTQPGNAFQEREDHKNYENVLNEQSKGKAGKMKSGHGNHQNRKQTNSKSDPE